jgi:hypothetical protein
LATALRGPAPRLACPGPRVGDRGPLNVRAQSARGTRPAFSGRADRSSNFQQWT